jgi:hypothetical protein
MAQQSGLYYSALAGTKPAERELFKGVCYCCKTAMATGPKGEIYAAWRHVFAGNFRDMGFTVSRDGGKSFSPLLRVHGYQSRTEPWRYGPEVEARVREYLELRYRLLPYIYSQAAAVTFRSALMRPLVMTSRPMNGRWLRSTSTCSAPRSSLHRCSSPASSSGRCMRHRRLAAGSTGGPKHRSPVAAATC